MTDYSDEDIAPGKPCPECGDPIVTWIATQVREHDISEMDDCWLYTDNVCATGPTAGFSGNVIIIDHNGPSMEA